LALSRTSELLLQYKNHIDLATYNTRKNGRSGLDLVGKKVPFVRLFRRGDERYYGDLELKGEPKEILHFLLDRATYN
jgi:hypothetical protein